MAKLLEARLVKLEELILARSRGKKVSIWFDAETETEEQAIARARKEGRLKGNDEPRLMRWQTWEEADAFERSLAIFPAKSFRRKNSGLHSVSLMSRLRRLRRSATLPGLISFGFGWSLIILIGDVSSNGHLKVVVNDHFQMARPMHATHCPIAIAIPTWRRW